MAHSSAAIHLNVTRESGIFLGRSVNASAEYRIFICYATRDGMTVWDIEAAPDLRGFAVAIGLG